MELNNVEIIKIGEEKVYGESFRKLEFVVKDDSGMYEQEIQFSITQDKIDNFVQYNKVGQRVDIKFNLNGRSWLKEGEPEENRRWFNELNAWSVFKAEGGEEATELTSADLPDEDHDDLPF